MSRNRPQRNRSSVPQQQLIEQSTATEDTSDTKVEPEETIVEQESTKSITDRKHYIIRDLLRKGLPVNLFDPLFKIIWQQTTIEVDIRDASILEVLRYPFAGREKATDFATPSFLSIASNPVSILVEVYNSAHPEGQERVEVFQNKKGTLLLEGYYSKYKEYLRNTNDLIQYISNSTDEEFIEFETRYFEQYYTAERIKF